MASGFAVVSGVAAFKRAVDRTAENLIYAQAVALTRTAKDLERLSNESTELRFDRPVPFTRRSGAIRPATKRRLVATVFVKDIQAAYLERQEIGGARRPKKRYIPVPARTDRNQHGNMPRGHVKALVHRRDVFQGTVRGVAGIWRREGRRLTLLVTYAEQAGYERRFHWRETMHAGAVQRFPLRYRDALKRLFR